MHLNEVHEKYGSSETLFEITWCKILSDVDKILKGTVPSLPLGTDYRLSTPSCQYRTRHHQREVGSSSEMIYVKRNINVKWLKRFWDSFHELQKHGLQTVQPPAGISYVTSHCLVPRPCFFSKWRENWHSMNEAPEAISRSSISFVCGWDQPSR